MLIIYTCLKTTWRWDQVQFGGNFVSIASTLTCFNIFPWEAEKKKRGRHSFFHRKSYSFYFFCWDKFFCLAKDLFLIESYWKSYCRSYGFPLLPISTGISIGEFVEHFRLLLAFWSFQLLHYLICRCEGYNNMAITFLPLCFNKNK